MKLCRSNTPPGRKILVIYDDPQIMTLLRLYLQKACKDTVLETADVNEGLAKAQATLPDLIIIEMTLPESDGPEICKRLKTIPALQHIPILLVGTKPPEEIYSEVHDLGVRGYLTYPFGLAELKKARGLLLKGNTYWPPLTNKWLLFDQNK